MKLTCGTPTVDGLIWIPHDRHMSLLRECLHQVILRRIRILQGISRQPLDYETVIKATYLEFVYENVSDGRHHMFLLLQKLESVHEQIIKVQAPEFLQRLFVLLVQLQRGTASARAGLLYCSAATYISHNHQYLPVPC
jgi:hypothetical protein